MPDWRRWNNYGIALLDHRQFAASAEAFARVADLDEKYRAFALTNRALAYIELDRWDDAAGLIDQALKLDPQNMRAVFQRGRIYRVKGKLDLAEKDFRAVNAAYPRDRLTLQQLGELMKIKRDYKAARNFYEQVLAIDPEDAGSHYNLMLVYSKLGMKEESKQEAKIFADLKDDPGALAVATDFLRRNPQMKNLSVPYHVIDLKPYNELQALLK
jgi:tetratricopeptide (TPR) repeat protein